MASLAKHRLLSQQRLCQVHGLILCALLGVTGSVFAQPVNDPQTQIGANPPLSIQNNNRQETINCAGKHVTIKGNHNHIKLYSFCDSVEIEGQFNIVKIESSYAIRINGNRNTIYWKDKVGGTQAPTIKDLGKKNIVRQKPHLIVK